MHSVVVPAWSAENEEEETQSSSTIKAKISKDVEKKQNNNGNISSTQQVVSFPHFQELPLEVKTHILEMVAFDLGEDKKDLSSLAVVCTQWNIDIINNKNLNLNPTPQDIIKKSWLRGLYNITDPQTIVIFDQFYKGALVYRPTQDSDEGMIRLPISDLRNPLEGTFDLSKCGDAGTFLSFATGYRKGQTPANDQKVEIWFTPRFLVDKEMEQLAQNHHMRTIIAKWDAAAAPLGIFWTWGGWNSVDHMKWCEYLTSESMEKIGKENWVPLKTSAI